ncbi:MAG: DUF4249 family protein [Mariniphaga sp.]
MRYFFRLLLSALVVLSSCREEIEIDFPEMEIKPVVNCLFSPSYPLKMHVGVTKTPTDTSTYIIENANISVSGNDGTHIVLHNIGEGYYSADSFIPDKGVIYILEVDIPGFKRITASGSIPVSESAILSIQSKSGFKTDPVTGTGEEPTIPVQNLEIVVKDDIEVGDFWGISIVQTSVVNRNGTIVEIPGEYSPGYYWGSDDPIIVGEGLGYYNPFLFMFRDIAFSSQTEKIKLYVSKDIKSAYWLRFFNFSPEAFQYIKSWVIHEYTQDYDFWEIYEPQPLYSNIENGYGIFAGYSMQLYDVYPDSTITFE